MAGLSVRSVLRCVFTMDSANLLCMPLYSSVQGSYKFSSSPPSNTAPQWMLGLVLPRFRGLGKGISLIVIYSLYGLRSTLSCSIICNPRVLVVS